MEIDNLENERENKNRRIDRPDMFYSLYIPESEEIQIQLENYHLHCTFTLNVRKAIELKYHMITVVKIVEAHQLHWKR